ncbi:hen1 methyltransferase isoform X5 [Leptinotarsa decemlineata]|uniref:hen1 methyltransferase isoform X5 n=1 Tax=Leptinotarsa decemlineata TaxID=7539 RepID=UPI003D30401B
MLILFHYLGFCLYQFLRNRKRIKFLESIEKRKLSLLDNTEVVKDLENNLKFEPPVFRQRYGKVFEILLDERWRKQIKKLCDFGCAEFGLFIFLKRLSSLNNIFCIDIEECTLRENIGRIHPLTVEYLRRRESPLQISVFAGSVADPDYRLECTDAVVAIELIEHLYPDALDAFPYNIFAFVEPKLVIITTPNSDFNILFSSDPKRMRHYDHKFEWNREQFQDWANNIVNRFPDYTVTFSGIGEGPAGTEILGECSQMAVFVRKDMLDDSYISVSYSSPCICDSNSPCKGLTELAKMLCTCTCMLCCPNFSHGVCTYMSFSKHISDFEIQENDEANPSYGIYYKFIEKVDYPFYCDDRTEEQKMIDEFRYRINTFGHFRGRFFVEERNRSEIPLVDLIYGPDSCFISQSELSKLLTKYDYKIEECIIQETGQLENCVIYEPVMEKYSSSSEASGYESDIPMYQPNDESLSDWDDWDEPYIKEESNENFESSTELISSEVSPSENQSDVEEQNNQSETVMDAGYQNSSCNDLPKTCSREQNYAFGQALSCEDLTSKNRKIRFSNTVDKKSFTFPEINESNQFQKIVEIRPGRTFMNNFLNPRAERVDKSGEIDWFSEPGPSSAIHVPQIKKKILKNSSSENLVTAKSISDSIVENVFSTLEKKSESSKVVTNQVPEENSFSLAVENERKIEGNPNNGTESNRSDTENGNIELNGGSVENEAPNVEDRHNSGHPTSLFTEFANEGIPSTSQQLENQVARASREALFDPNSVQDLLEDFEIPAPLQEAVDILDVGNNVVLLGIRSIASNINPQVLSVENGFPHWLLQIMGTQAVPDGSITSTSSDEPHYYCQGDGLGVHPSITAVEVEDEEDEETTSSNNTDFAEVDQGVSSQQDMSSLPEDSQGNTESQEFPEETDDGLRMETTEQTEYFDTVSSSSDTGIDSSKST